MSLINGLPAHVLIVHAVVVLVPLAALVTLAAALWPALQRRLGLIVPLLAVIAAAFVPVAKEAGEWLERHVEENDLVERHASLGDQVLPWAAALALVAAAGWGVAWSGRRAASDGGAAGPSTWVRVLLVAVTVVVATGSVVSVVRAGDSGAQAAWHDAYSTQQTNDDD